MLPSLPQYMIALLKILLAAAPTSKAKTDSINIMTDVLPEEMPMTVMQSMKLGRTTLLLGDSLHSERFWFFYLHIEASQVKRIKNISVSSGVLYELISAYFHKHL